MVFKKIEPGVMKFEKKDDEIVGVLIRIADSTKFNNKVYHLEVQKKGETVQMIVFGTKVLDDRMAYIKPGDTVKIVYKGLEPSEKGNDTKIFDVFKDEPNVIATTVST